MYRNPLDDYTMRRLADRMREKPQGIENDPEKIALAELNRKMKKEDDHEGPYPFIPKR